MNTENNVENAAVETAETTTATAPAERPERTFAPEQSAPPQKGLPLLRR